MSKVFRTQFNPTKTFERRYRPGMFDDTPSPPPDNEYRKKPNYVGELPKVDPVTIVESICPSVKSPVISVLQSSLTAPANLLHYGLIQYVFCCWRDEVGVILAPSVIWATVVSEIASKLMKDPASYSKFFTDTPNDKKTITIACGRIMDFTSLRNELLAKMPDPTFLDDLLPAFSDDSAGFREFVHTTLLQMGTPFYNYECTECGIPNVCVEGTKADWELMLSHLQSLDDKLPQVRPYTTKVRKAIEDIVLNAFGDSASLGFWDNLFTVDGGCGSGHPYYIKGWISKFYASSAAVLEEYPHQIAYCPYKFVDDDTNYCKVSGLFQSTPRIIDGHQFYYPEFGTALCQISHEAHRVLAKLPLPSQ